MRYIGCQSGFGILVEAFEQSNSKHVLYAEGSGRIPAGDFIEIRIGILSLLLLGRSELMAGTFHFYGVDEAGDGNELFRYNGIFGQGHTVIGGSYSGRTGILYGSSFSCKAEPVALCGIYVEIFVTVCRLFQFYGDSGGFIFLFPFRHIFRARNVTVVLNTSVFVHLHGEVVVHCLHLVFIADVAGKHSGIEVGGGLVLIVSPSIQVIYVETKSQPLVCID